MSTFATKKDPSAVIDFQINWAATMAESSPADSISTSSWTADHGVVVDSNSKTTSTTKVWVSGGRVGKYSNLVNTIVTAGGRTLERTIVLDIVDK